LLAFGSAITYGAVTTLGKFALSSTPALELTALAYVVGALVLLPAAPRKLPPRNSVLFVALAALLGAITAPYLFFAGLSLTTAGNAALLSNGEAVFTTLFAIFIFQEKLGRQQFVASLVVISGIIVVSTNLDLQAISFFKGLKGNLLVLAATLFWGLDNNISRIVSQRMDPTVFTRYKNAIGGSTLILLTFLSDGFAPIPQRSIPFILAIGIFAVGLSTAFLMNALRRLGAIRAVMIFSTSSLFGLLFAFLILHEEISPIQVLGAAAIFVGLYVLNRGGSVGGAKV
jgi:drug/metabolite transporter (DMT)-like permease